MDIKDLQKNWDELGKTDPLWAVITLPDKKGNKWRPDEFFKYGVEEIDRVMDYVRVGIEEGAKLECGGSFAPGGNLKRGFFFGLICNGSPVRGFLPVRPAIACTSNVPKPTKVSLSPFFNISVTVSVNASKNAFASVCGLPVLLASALINSALFIVFIWI